MARGNPKKLIPNSQRTPQELREQTKKGGIRSGQVRREKADILKTLRLLMDDKVEDDSGLEISRAERIALTIVEKAEAGDLGFVKELMDRIYGKPAQTVDMQSSDGSMSPAAIVPMSFDQWKKAQEE